MMPLLLSLPAQQPSPVTQLAVKRLVTFFEGLSCQSLSQLDAFYTENAWFKNPLNDVRGARQIRRVFNPMYAAMHEPRFVVTDSSIESNQCLVTWEFEFYFNRLDKTSAQKIRGVSHIQFTAVGLVDFQRDYWDTAQESYTKLPSVGGLVRWLKKWVKW